jgi:hypothetical protein
MRVLIFEDNLLWSARLEKTLLALGTEVSTFDHVPTSIPGADAALINLGSRAIDPRALVPALKAAGIRVVAYAGHKETELRELGRELGCDRIASNGEMTFKLAQILGLPPHTPDRVPEG